MPPKRKTKSNKEEDFSLLKVAQLKKECIQRGLDTDGKKADLIERLEDYEKANTNPGGKKVKKEEEEEVQELSMKEKLKKLAEEEKESKQKTFQVDSLCPRYSSGKVVGDFDCMLNQTNIGQNNNKFYVIQLIEDNGIYFVWSRWGRVGESGQNALKGFHNDCDQAEKEFKKKFKDKTKNTWDDRENFTPHAGKYTLIEMDGGDETVLVNKVDVVDGNQSIKQTIQKVKACKLDVKTQSLINLIFDNDMFKEAMAKMNIDVKKMPLGKISKAQIAKGFEVLEEIEEALEKKQHKNFAELTSRFYTLIPHSFGRNRPPTIDDSETLRLKFEMLLVLGDIEVAQSLQKTTVKVEEEEVDHPCDVNYGLLKCNLKHVDRDEEIFKIIAEYTTNTDIHSSLKLIDVWEVERQDEDKRFAEHKDISYRKLLWHGTNIAVVVAILKSGLRIMPHSGGRVGAGIYFASENSKSSAYVRTCGDGTGIMFLNEVALGKQHVITRDNSALKKAPQGFDSVLAQGRQEPDVKEDVKIQIDGNDVIVPKGKPTESGPKNSSFYQSEYLVYKESQCRIRYLLKVKFR